LIYDTRSRTLESHYLSLTGTIVNCAGGPTPWGSWISCEESSQLADEVYRKNHGFTFEVPAKALKPVHPIPLTAMGRFNHEAVAVDAASGIVYQTEDREDGLFYRFIPTRRRQLAAGGRLQALKIRDLWEGTHPTGHHQRYLCASDSPSIGSIFRMSSRQWATCDSREQTSAPLDSRVVKACGRVEA